MGAIGANVFVVFAVVLLNISVISAEKYQFGDTIIIDAQKSSSSTGRTKRQNFFLYTPFVQYAQQRPECVTTAGEPGVCDTLSNCYPVLYTAAYEHGLRNLTNQVLAEDLLVASGPCATDTDLAANYICCPTKSRFAPQYPIFKPSKQPPSTIGDAPRVPDCGDKRVVGGQVAPAGKYPWIAALMSRGRQFCGGSLIDSKHIMTAAHCVSHMTQTDIDNFRVYLGAQNVQAPSEPNRQTYRVTRVLYNRGFSHQHLRDDIAVVRLASEVTTFNSKVQPICLSAGSPPYDTGSSTATLAGWGKQGSNLPQSASLKQVDVPVLPNRACNAKYGQYAPVGITSGMVCAGGGGKDACQGDSGGPLMRPSSTYNNRMEQIGIVSWGIGCGTYPGVYTRVDQYRSWLDRARKL